VLFPSNRPHSIIREIQRKKKERPSEPILDLGDAIRIGRNERLAMFDAAKAEAAVF